MDKKTKPKTIGLLGVGNDYKHQLIISQLLYSLMDKFKSKSTYRNFIVFPEFSIKNNKLPGLVPDLSIWNIKNNRVNEPLIVIEICWPKQVNNEIKKVTSILKQHSSIREGFIIDKESLEVQLIKKSSENTINKFKGIAKSEIIFFNFDKELKNMNFYNKM